MKHDVLNDDDERVGYIELRSEYNQASDNDEKYYHYVPIIGFSYTCRQLIEIAQELSLLNRGMSMLASKIGG